MIMKKLSASFLVILALISCQKEPLTKIELNSDYFPLKVGNYWNYELDGKYLVKDSMQIDGKEYFEIINDYGTSSFYAIRDNKIYVKDLSINSNEEMKFDLTAQTNDTWTYGPGSVTLANRNATITLGNLQVDSCLQFNFYNNNLIDYGSSIWLAPGIGLIQRTCQECFGSGFEVIKLIKVNINNKESEFK
jgi:hypothetical protein